MKAIRSNLRRRVTLRRFIIALAFGFMLICSARVFADGRNSAAVTGGIVWPENTNATWGVSANTRWHFEDNWAVEPDFGYWKKNKAETLHLGSGDLLYSLRDIHLGANLLYMGTWNDVGLYAGGGAAAHWRKRETFQDVIPPKNNPDLDETRLGLQILFGVDIPITNAIDVTTVVRDDFIFRGNLDTLTVLSLSAGLRFYWD